MYNSLMITQNNTTTTPYDELLFRKESGPVATYLMNVSPSSHQTILACLKACLRALNPEYVETSATWLVAQGMRADNVAYMFDWHLLRRKHVLFIRERLQELYELRYANSVLSFMRGIIRECCNLGLMTRDDMLKAVDMKGFYLERVPAGRAVSSNEFHTIISYCLNIGNTVGLRDAAIFACFSAGLRRQELSNLDLDDYERDTGKLTVLGKGNKLRSTYLSPFAQEIVDRWLEVRGTNSGPLFVHMQEPSFLYLQSRLGIQGIASMVDRRSREAEITRFTCHDLRRGVLTDLLDRGVPAEVVADLAGHSNIDTLYNWYDRRDEKSEREAFQSLNLPFFDVSDT